MDNLARAEPPPASFAPGASAPPSADAWFRAIYEAQFAYVFRSLRRLGVAEADVEDLTHDVFVAFYRGRESYELDRPIKPWLFGICFRVASDHRRRARHRFEVAAPADEHARYSDPRPLPDELVARAEDRRLVLLGLDGLDLDRRAVFVLHELDGCSMPEIAAALSVPLNTCYSRLRLARADFSAAVRRVRSAAENQGHP